MSNDFFSMRGIVKQYEMGGEVQTILKGIDLDIDEGEFLSVLGPSGSGKSTLMNIIGCLDVADEGSYLFDGQEITDYSEDELADIRNRKIGFVFQQFNLLPKLTARENVELPLIYQGMSAGKRRARSEEVLGRVGLLERMNHKPTELSGGQQQRVAIARALAAKPALILADEPTGNLDSKTGAEVMALFHELHEAGNTIVLITHDAKIAAQTPCAIHIHDGRVLEPASEDQVVI